MPTPDLFIRRDGTKLYEGDRQYRIAGSNIYYLGYLEEPTLEATLDLAESIHSNVIRLWAYCERTEGHNVYFQEWSPAHGLPIPNGSWNGLERLDRAVASAARRGMRVILTLANNWKDFGGIPQYLKWFGLSSHDQFYRDGRCRAAYWLWVEQLLHRENTVTGRLYKDDPAVLAWELANEPRCSDVRDGEQLLLSWISEMATLIRSKAPNQLIAVGDEGFFNRKGAGKNELFNGSRGMNFEAILGIGAIDFGTYHLYGEWAKGQDLVEFGTMWIREHNEAAARANKPVLLEEYGVLPVENRPQIYESWLAEIERSNSLGDLLWMLGLPKGPGQQYGLDGYVITDGPELIPVREHARRLLRQTASGPTE
jgi:mannan endo-1,4-beta-mannosidase